MFCRVWHEDTPRDVVAANYATDSKIGKNKIAGIMERTEAQRLWKNQRLLESLAADKLAPPELIITLFQKKAEGEPDISPLERFAAGVTNAESPYNVLPAIGFVTHIYTLHLYEPAGKHPQALVEIYNELYRANPYLDEIGHLAMQVAGLEEDGLKFVRSFLRKGLF